MIKKNKIFIIAEIGVNHNGLISNAIKLIDYAVEANCDAVKFQTFNPENLLKKILSWLIIKKEIRNFLTCLI